MHEPADSSTWRAPCFPDMHDPAPETLKNHGIRPDYRPRTEAATFSEDPAAYWTEKRIARAALYQRPVYREAARLLATLPSRRVLDVGAGYPIKVREELLPLAHSIQIIDQPCLAPLMRERFPDLPFLGMDLEAPEATPVADFDLIVCADVVEHLLDPDPLVAFLRGSLASKGMLVLSTPERDIERGRGCLESPQAEHVREWNRAELHRWLSHHGFKVLRQVLLPKKRVTGLKQAALPLLRVLRPKRYASCQMVVCMRDEPDGKEDPCHKRTGTRSRCASH